MNTARLSKLMFRLLLSSLSVLPVVASFDTAEAAPAKSKKPATKAKPSKQATPRQGRLDSYLLGPGDRIRIDVFNVPEYSTEYPVLIDGTINLPVVGTVLVNGLSLPQASALLSNQYARFVRNPLVTVGLVSPRPIKIAIAGEVNRAGSYTMSIDGSGGTTAAGPGGATVSTGGTSRQFPTLSQAVQLAGGASQTADLRRVKVQRRGRVATLNLLRVLQGADGTQDVSLRDGDTIYIPTATSVNSNDIARLSGSNIATQDSALKVAIIGEVTKPGTYSIKGEASANGNTGRVSQPTLTEALKLAGGATPSADISKIKVKRSTKSGRSQTIGVDLVRLLDKGDYRQDLILQDGDTIYLPSDPVIGSVGSRRLVSSSFGPQVQNPIKVAIVGDVNRPGTYVLKGEANNATSVNNPNSNLSPPTVTQAILSAGGIKPTANIREVVLQRFNRSGRGQSVKVNLWNLLTQGDISQDLLLQEGDRILIPQATAINPREVDTLANAPFSPATIEVGVVGEVAKGAGTGSGGGRIKLPPNTTLNQALLAAGSFDQVRANKGSVDLIRLNPNGSVTKRSIGVDFAQGINEQNNPTLRNNDVIVVGRSGLASVGDSIGAVFNPLAPLLTLFGIFR
jgi:polysaccharide biosynthesis/export protein